MGAGATVTKVRRIAVGVGVAKVQGMTRTRHCQGYDVAIYVLGARCVYWSTRNGRDAARCAAEMRAKAVRLGLDVTVEVEFGDVQITVAA